MKTITLSLIFAALVLGGCASTKKAAEEATEVAVHPLTGAWNYTIDSPQGEYTGVISFAGAGDMLEGSIAASEQPDQVAPLEELMYDSETSTTTFKFDGGEFGLMIVKMTLNGDALDGLMTVTQFGVDVPIVAKKAE